MFLPAHHAPSAERRAHDLPLLARWPAGFQSRMLLLAATCAKLVRRIVYAGKKGSSIKYILFVCALCYILHTLELCHMRRASSNKPLSMMPLPRSVPWMLKRGNGSIAETSSINIHASAIDTGNQKHCVHNARAILTYSVLLRHTFPGEFVLNHSTLTWSSQRFLIQL